MAGIAGLSQPMVVEQNGILYLAGYRNRGQYLRRSADGGRTWLRFSDGSEERLIGTPSDPARAGLIKMDSQGRRLVVAVPNGPQIDIYVSVDEGETWGLESTV